MIHALRAVSLSTLVVCPQLLAVSAAPAAEQEFKGKIARSYEESEEWWAERIRPPKSAPNVIIFLLDDTGFAQVGSFGGLVKTPSIDRLAGEGSATTTSTPPPCVRRPARV